MQRTISSRLICLAIILIIQTAFCFSQDKLSGTAAVSPTGAASYSIAIDAPKGVGDLMPSIGIAYNSQAGNGVVGFGCNITGLSAITRGMKTIAHDNSVKGISYDNNCALYLDGKRLLLKSGTEGTDGCIYAPEGEPLTNVTLHNSLSTTYCWFEVDTNDGMVYEYGHTDGRQFISNPSAVAAWHITKATNPMGQSITYQYNVDGLYLYPLTISYGGDNSVNFEYEARTDSVFFPLRNNRGYIGKRLKSITTKAGNSTFRTYTMSYNTTSDATNTKFSRLTSIHETGENGTSSHNLTAQWNYLPEFTATCQESIVNPPSGNNLVVYGYRFLFTGDWNNDGVSDIFHIAPLQVTSGNYIEVRSYNSHVSNGIVSFVSSTLCSLPPDYQIADIVSQKGKSFVVDINGDGKNDLVFPCLSNDTYNNNYALKLKGLWGGQTSNTIVEIMPETALVTGDEMPLYTAVDLNGNGQSDIIFLEKQGVNNHYALHITEYVGANSPSYTINLTLQSAPKHIFTSDFNHDGLTDLMIVSDSGYRIFYNQGGTSLQNLFVNSSTLNTTLTNHDHLEQGDFNGDGILDLIWNDNNSSQLFFEIGNADGTFTCHQAFNLSFDVKNKNSDEGTWNCIVTDLDHDGKSDVVLNLACYYPIGIFKDTHTYWLISNGTSLTKKKEAISDRPDDAKVGHLFAGDFKGNGYVEVANYGYDCYNGTNTNTEPTVNIYRCGSHNISNGKVNFFRDSNGRKATFAYSSMTSDLVYTKGTGSSYPVIDVAVPLCVTSQISESGGSPITTQTNYTYKGLRAHLQGRGLLGFSEVTTTETNTGKSIKTAITSQDAPYYVPTQTVVTTTQDGETATIVSTMTLKTHSTSSTIPNNNYLLLPMMKTDTDIYGHETVTNYTYDTSKHYLTFEYTEYDNDYNMFRQKQYSYSQNKIAGAYRPVSIIFTQMHPDGSQPFEKETEFTYDSYGRKTSVTEYPGESLELVTTYQYDDNGNITKEKYSGYGISNNTETNYQYSSDGKFLTQKSNIARVVGYNRNVFGDIMSETDLTNLVYPQTTTYTRNGFGTLTKEQKPTGETTTWTKTNTLEYGGNYCITATPNYGPKVKTWYDALGNELRTETTGIDGVEISTTTTYNAQGQVTAKANVHGCLTTTESYTYDGQGRTSSFASTNGTSIAYSYSDCSVTTIKNGQTYTKYYDEWHNVVESIDPVSSVNYTYHSTGKPSEIETDGHIVEIGYDDYGNQISLDDPDAGLTTYEYDALHRVISQTDARGIVTTFSYDGAGRITQKTVGGTTTTYSYGSSGNDAGRLIREQTEDRTVSYTYNDKGQLSQKTYSMTGEQPLTFSYTYNSNGTLLKETYPQGIAVTYVYEGGHCIESNIKNANICFTELDNGRKVVKRMGGKLKVNSVIFDPVDPRELGINSVATTLPMGGGIEPALDLPIHNEEIQINSYYVQNSDLTHTSEYDERGFLTKLATEKDNMTFNFQSGTGNLLSRTGMTSQTEAFTYDNIDRLTQTSGGISQIIDYDDNGNIYGKTGPGFYTYSSSRPHAVTKVTNPQSSISSATQVATYTAFGKIATLSDNGYGLDFTYGPDEQRWKTVLRNNGNIIRTTLYADNYERMTENGQTRHFYYFDGGVVYVLNDGASNGTFYYTFTDHLGSITRIYNKNGAKVFSAEYDAWGKQTVSLDTLGFHRGYCGHEMLPEFGLINMNGRLYDPALGRFLSPDNYVQMPDFSQSFNRYSYCLNNPLKYVDPDGEIAWWVVAAIAGGYMGGVATNQGELNPIHWDYSNPITYGGILIGGIAGGITGSAIAGSTAWNISFSISNPYLSAGVTIGATAASGLKYGFHWTTAAGGEYNNVEKVVKKTVERAGQAFDNYVEQYRRHMDNIHTGLDVIGMIPGGDFADFANAGLYLLEGDFSNAGLSAVAMVPVIGDIATGGKLVNKGFSSYRKFKKAYGKAGDGMEWHHIVEQRPANISQFGAERIHNIDNMIALPTEVHRKISGFYSSKPANLKGLRVRDWLNGQSYDKQYEYGLQVLKKYGY